MSRARSASVWAVVVLVGPALGCLHNPMTRPPTPVEAGLDPASVADATTEPLTAAEVTLTGLARVGAATQAATPCARKRSVLCLSGGGAYGAYSAGVLVGWTRTGTRPEFDVVTGVSTGAIVAAFAFLGPEYDAELQRVYTTLETDDIFRIKKSLRALLSEGLADNSPLGREIRRVATAETLAKVAVEHAKGRRLYVGTTDLDARRQVIWDMGAIAARGTPESRDQFARVILASAAIPGFFPPVRIPVTIDGTAFEERHVDGGVTTAVFFQPPYVPPECCGDPQCGSLAGSDVYIIVAGKLYADAEPVTLRAPNIAGSSISTLLYAQTRSNLAEIYATAVVTGMNYHLTAIPQDFPVPASSTDFDPAEMSRMFDEGVRQVTCGTAWRTAPPGLLPGERVAVRGGTDLTLTDGRAGPVARRGAGPLILWPAPGWWSATWPPFNRDRSTLPWSAAPATWHSKS